MDTGQPTTTTEVSALIGIVYYYRYMWPQRSHRLAPLKEADSKPKGRNMVFNDAPGYYFKELKRMVSDETLLSYTHGEIPFIVNTDASDKQLGDIIGQNNKPIEFFSMILSKT